MPRAGRDVLAGLGDQSSVALDLMMAKDEVLAQPTQILKQLRDGALREEVMELGHPVGLGQISFAQSAHHIHLVCG